ncbi:hypothetical protein CJJ09_005360 [Candidozyma auris]|nr:hypothetical protein CJJ09_005360 [[Candida] auris]
MLKVATNGFDRLNWDVHLDPKDEEAEASSGTEEAAEPKKLSRKMKKELKSQKKANARRLRSAKRGISEAVSENSGFNEYTAKQEIKRIHNRIVSRMPSQGVSDFKVFHYESIAFYKSDVDHLVPGEWLNDNNIALVYELLTKYFLKETPFGHEVLLLYPSLVQLFLHYPSVEEVASILPQKELSKSKLVFIPFNFVDSMIDLEDANNGDHWALCVLSIMEKDYNFDDCGVFCIMFTVYLVAQVISGEPIDIDIRDVNFNALSGRLFMMELVKRLSEKDGPN